MNYYHFTNGCQLAKIVNERIIRTSKSSLDEKEKPAAWLTKSPEWDVACNVEIVKNTKELAVEQDYFSDKVETKTATNDYMKKEIGMCRILINESLPVISWAKFRYVSGITWTSYYIIDENSRHTSPVNQWYCKFAGIPSRYWEGIEMFVDDQWVRWDEKMSIQDFVDLCLSCNGKQPKEEELINGFPKIHAQSQIDFIEHYHDEIREVWEANKDKKGYIEVYVAPNYKPFPSGFEFIEKRIKKSIFKPLIESETDTYALVHFYWQATYTQYKMAVAL